MFNEDDKRINRYRIAVHRDRGTIGFYTHKQKKKKKKKRVEMEYNQTVKEERKREKVRWNARMVTRKRRQAFSSHRNKKHRD